MTLSPPGYRTGDGPKRQPVISYVSAPWDIGWSSRHQILRGLADRGWDVVYSSGALSLWDRGTNVWRSAPLLGRVEQIGNIFVDRPGKLLTRWPRQKRWDRVAVRAHARRIRAANNSTPGSPITAILFDPAFWPYVEFLGACNVVYFVCDAHSLAPDWTEERADFEAKLVERADLIAGFSREMLDLLPGDGPRRGRILPTGVDVELFMSTEESEEPADLSAIPHPRIGYIGRINQKVDVDLVTSIAREAPHLQWIFVGPVNEASPNGDFAKVWRSCLCFPNVHHLGPKSHDEVPRYMRHMDINTLCYRTEGGWWVAGYPLKMHEYLAVGRPVISSDLSSVRPFAEVIDIARTPHEWAAAIDKALTQGGVATAQKRRAVALENTWDKRIDQLEEWIFALISSSGTR